MKRSAPNSHRRRPTHRLVRIALRSWDTDRSWSAITELHMRGSPAVLERVRRLSRSSNWRRRALGMRIASQLRQRRRDAEFGSVEYEKEATQQLLLAGLRDAREAVVEAAVAGLSHRPHAAALAELVRLAEHRSAGLRWAVAVALGRYDEPEAIQALLRLARDTDDDVRDWATFGLGTMHDVDTPEVRELLWCNLRDPDPDVRGEALVGLAERGDRRAVAHLTGLLGEDCRVFELIAAEKFADRGLLPALQALQPAIGDKHVDEDWLRHLQEAIKASSDGAPVAT